MATVAGKKLSKQTVTKDQDGDYAWAVYDESNRAVSQSFTDRKQAQRAAVEHIKRTGKFANVIVTEGEHEGEVDWQPWWNDNSKRQFEREHGIKLKSFGGFCRAVADVRSNHQERVYRGEKALAEVYQTRFAPIEKGINELSGLAGGYLVPVEYTTEFLRPLNERAIIYPRAWIVPMTTKTARGPMLDAETAQSSGTAPFFGGLLFKWGSQAATFGTGETEPTFRELTLNAWDLLGYALISNQMLQDMGPEGEDKLLKAFGQAAAWYAEYAFFTGQGASYETPLGILNAPCAINVTRAGAGHIVQADVAGMVGRLLPMCWMNSIWCCSVSALTDVAKITGFQANIARRDADDPCIGYLENRPLYVTDKLPKLAAVGDIVLFDPSLYVVGNRMEAVVDVSDQAGYGMSGAGFASNQSLIKTWLRLDAKPMLANPVTLPDASTQTTVSPIVMLTIS